MSHPSDEIQICSECPWDLAPILEVVTVILRNENKILFLKRANGQLHEGKWCLPGGKAHAGEASLAAMKRELSEETGIDLPLSAFHFIEKNYVFAAHWKYVSYLFETTQSLPSDSILLNPREHTAFCWIEQAAVFKLELIPSERLILQKAWRIFG